MVTSPISSTIIPHDSGNMWAAYNGDNTIVLSGFPDNVFHYMVCSIPFASLYTYSATPHDQGNCESHEEFFVHFSHFTAQLFRVMKPGRNVSIHCMALPTSKVRDGVIGLSDFPGGVIRVMQEAGFIWHSDVSIWKDPVTAMQRTKALGLLHKQLLKDSVMSRMGIPDRVLTFRKPGTNAEPVFHTREDYPVDKWQHIASPHWNDIDMGDTLQWTTARDPEDERHICPLQLEVYLRCLELWTNPGDIVLEPYGGIGSGGYVALGGRLRRGKVIDKPRRVVSIELKPSYYRIMVENLRRAEPGGVGQQVSLLDICEQEAPTVADVAEIEPGEEF